MNIELAIGEKGPSDTYVYDADGELGIALEHIGHLHMSWKDGEDLLFKLAQEYITNPYARKTQPFHIEFDKK